MNILVLGSGGREHAIAWSLKKSSEVEHLFVAPGNGGTQAIATNVPRLNIESGRDVLNFAKDNAIDLVVIGPEAPLVAGVADVLRSAGIAVFGPDSQGALLEGSKSYSKEFMLANGVETAAYASFPDVDSALEYLHEQGVPVVIKADGLAAGKGVVVAHEMEDAEEALRACFDGAFGAAGSKVVIEECLEGPECSLLAFVSGGKCICMETAQDHKRAYDGDRGPNTGGMGAYSPVPFVDEGQMKAMRKAMKTSAKATAREPFKQDYRGVLYGGFMLTAEGPKVLEFNARFGDPETQVVLPRLKSDLAQVMMAVAEGRPQDIELKWSDKWAVCVVLASEGYPGPYGKGKVILGIDEAEAVKGVTVFHAGTKVNFDGELITSGGRVLNVVATGKTFAEARKRAYSACKLIQFEGKQYRRDIGKAAMEFAGESR